MWIREMQRRAYETALKKGWWDDVVDADGVILHDLALQKIPEKLMLIVTEVSEAMEAYRQPRAGEEDPCTPWYGPEDKPEGIASELADAVIRIGDLCGALGLDLEGAILEKMTYNERRPYRHGGKRA